MRVLIAGAGAMARKHIEAYRKIEDVEVAGIVSRPSPRAISLVKEYEGFRLWESLEDAVKESKAEILSVCVPTALHPAFAIQGMEWGLHVVTEKPIALTLEEGQHMIEVSRKTGRKFTVVFNRRFNEVWDEAIRRLPSLGSPLVYGVQDIRSVRPKLAMHSRSGNGGPVVDCAVHDFDMLLHLFGKPRSVFATGDIFGSRKPSLAAVTDFAIDTAHITVEFEKAHRAYIFYGWGFPEGSTYWQYREFLGPEGILRLMGEFGEVIEHYRAGGVVETIRGLKENGHERILRLFVDAVRGKREVPITGEEALEASRIALAALGSIETGRVETL
jgi:predicted dehydrogenase